MYFMKELKSIINILVVLLIISSCSRNVNPEPVKIGSQTWAAKNLDVSTFRNGDAIPEAKTNEEWVKAAKTGSPAWCYYGNKQENGNKYGKLYNWFAVADPRGLAPSGWHVPSDTEWVQMVSFLGGENAAAIKLKSTEGWEDIGNGLNTSGFWALPGGWRSSEGEFKGKENNGSWWSSTTCSDSNAWYISLEYMNNVVSRGSDAGKENAVSVRCIKD
jgi:uncharacterized protein (TIGR02145 family)